MPPKRRASTKVPHVNVKHVLDQPAAALAPAICALRGRPHPLAVTEARGVAKEAPPLLRRVQSAIHAAGSAGSGSDVHNVAAELVPAATALLLDAVSFSPEIENDILKNVTCDNGAVTALSDVFAFALEHHNVPVDAQVDVAELLTGFCEFEAAKARFGELFMERIATLVARPQLHFALHRELCSNLIGLVKCSRENKLRLPTYTPVVQALLTTTDFFLQLQCVELLYRVSRQHARLLDGVSSELPGMLYDGIRTLPNNQQLFDKMCDLVMKWNRQRSPRLIIDFHVTSVDVGGSRYTENARVFFSPKILMLLLPHTAADNVSVEYTTIRSIRLRGPSSMLIRLREPPASIATRLEVGTDGRDGILLTFTEESLAAFRESPVQKWINVATREAAQATRAVAATTVKKPEAEETGEDSAASPPGRLSHNRRIAAATSRLLLSQQQQQQLSQGAEGSQPAGPTPAKLQPAAPTMQPPADAPTGSSPTTTGYYPMPSGANVARPLDMNTPLHRDFAAVGVGAPSAASGLLGTAASALRGAAASSSKAALSSAADATGASVRSVRVVAPDEEDGVANAPSAAKQSSASAAKASAASSSRRKAASRRPRESIEESHVLDLPVGADATMSSNTVDVSSSTAGTSSSAASGGSVVVGTDAPRARSLKKPQGDAASAAPPPPVIAPRGSYSVDPDADDDAEDDAGDHAHDATPAVHSTGMGKKSDAAAMPAVAPPQQQAHPPQLLDILGDMSPGPAEEEEVMPNAPQQQPPATSTSRQPSRKARSEPGDLSSVAVNIQQVLADSPADALAPAGGNAGPPRGGAAAAAASGAQSLQALVGEVQQAAQRRLVELQEEAVARVDGCLETVQTTVNAARKHIASDLDVFREHCDTKITALRDAHLVVDTKANETVRELNDELTNVRAKRRRAMDGIAAIDAEFRSHVAKSEGREAEWLRQVKRHVEAEIARLSREAAKHLHEDPAAMLRGASRSSMAGTGASMPRATGAAAPTPAPLREMNALPPSMQKPSTPAGFIADRIAAASTSAPPPTGSRRLGLVLGDF